MGFLKRAKQRRVEKKSLVAMYGPRGKKMPTTTVTGHRKGRTGLPSLGKPR